ncbi:Hypothetical Protein FCC1311_060362, partial [Hondaea fermentalgiana]
MQFETDEDACTWHNNGTLVCQDRRNEFAILSTSAAPAVCQRHFCVKLRTPGTMSCFGAALHVPRRDAFVNPLSPAPTLRQLELRELYEPHWGMRQLHVRDVRTNFGTPIASISCGAWETCVHLENGNTICMGGEETVLLPAPAAAAAASTALVAVALAIAVAHRTDRPIPIEAPVMSTFC